MKFDVYSDPGHGWCRVPRQLLIDLGIARKISSYSYQRGKHVYLEEDMDLATFFEAMKEAGKSVEFREHHTDRTSKIRGYWPYTPDAAYVVNTRTGKTWVLSNVTESEKYIGIISSVDAQGVERGDYQIDDMSVVGG